MHITKKLFKPGSFKSKNIKSLTYFTYLQVLTIKPNASYFQATFQVQSTM